MNLLALPMGRLEHKAELYDLIGAGPDERTATLGDQGTDPDGPSGPRTEADDLLPDALGDDTIAEWIGEDGFDYADLAKPQWAEHVLSMRQLFERLVKPQADKFPDCDTLDLDFETVRIPVGWNDFDGTGAGPEWNGINGIAAALNTVYRSIASMARRHRKRLLLSGLTLGEKWTPDRYIDRVRGALAVLGHNRQPGDLTTRIPIEGLLVYHYQRDGVPIDEDLEETVYKLWAHRQAMTDCSSPARLWCGVSPFYERSPRPVEDDRLRAQLRVINDFDPDQTAVWLNVTRRAYIPTAAKHFQRMQDIAHDLN